MNTLNQEIFSNITDLLIKGVAPWRKPWGGKCAPFNHKRLNGENYRGVNVLLLESSAIKNEFKSNKWGTFKQWSELNRFVRKGEKHTKVIYYSTIEVEDRLCADKTKSIPLMKTFQVFNESQLTDFVEPVIEENKFMPIESVESAFRASPMSTIRVDHSVQRAYYSPELDYINLPKRETFTSSEGYYSTLLHELGHASGHTSRLKRESLIKINRFGSHEYSREELVAELFSAFSLAHLGCQTTSELQNSASYCASWLKALNEDHRMLMWAASQAQNAFDYFFKIENKNENKA